MKQYLKLLIAREGKEVLGRKGANLWVLILVMVATFMSIAFSEGSMLYLRDKMEDPFTNWVSISKGELPNDQFNAFRDSLYLESVKQMFDYDRVTMDQYTNFNMMGNSGHIRYLSARFFQSIESPLVAAVLDESNVVGGCCVKQSSLSDKTLGFVLTQDALRRLGYEEDTLPAYIGYLAANEGGDSLGLKLVQDDFYPVPVPVLAIVRRLPNNVDMMSANFFYEQYYNDYTHPFSFRDHVKDYLESLLFFVSEKNIEKFYEELDNCIPDSLLSSMQAYDVSDNINEMMGWKPGSILKVDFSAEGLDRKMYQQVADALTDRFDGEDVVRIYEFDTADRPSERSEYLSVEFNSLRHIKEFETYAKNHGIQIEMEQVNSKLNFNAVATMAGILSAAMVIFSIICIIMFMVNMLQSYFQKVKRNIGTFKAFGMNGRELISVYILLLIMIVCVAVAFALLITWMLQCVLPLCGVEKDGFNYLSLWNRTTYIATAVILISTVFTVIIVMTRLLCQTPGDLIYDRN